MQKGFLGGRNSLISALGSSQIASQMHIVRSKAPTQETQGKFMKQILFWLSISNLKWCTSVLCTTFPFPHTLKFGHAANLIQSGRTILSCSTLECEVKSTDQTFFVFLLRVACALCTEAFFQAFNRSWSSSKGCMKKYFMVKFPDKVCIVCSSFGKVKSPLKMLQTRSRSVQ